MKNILFFIPFFSIKIAILDATFCHSSCHLTAIAGAVFDVFKSDKVTKVGTITTESPNGFASIEVPEEGNYFLKETKAPKGYEPITDFIEVAVGRDNNIVEKTIYNDKQLYIKVIKQDEDNRAPLENAIFEVYQEDKETKVGTITTTLPDGSATIKVPHAGTYYLKELKAPEGYTLKSGFIEVNVDGTTNVVEKTIYNEQEEHEYFIKVIKQDEVNHAPLADAKFDLYQADKVTKIGTITTTLPNESASIKVPSLGTYYLKEVTAPDGYTLKQGFIEVAVDGSTNVVDKTIYNKQDKEYSIKVYKKDEDNNAPLGEAVFDVYKEDKKTKVGTITTTLPNGSGSLTVKEAGTYYLKEVTAPTGYILKSGFIEVTLNEAVNVVEKTIYNEKDRDYVINIIKKDRDDNSLLPNVVFDVFKEDKATKVGSITTNSNGFGSITLKKAGTYFVKEVSTPDGYILNPDFVQVELNKQNPVVNLNVYNEQEEKEYFLHIYKRDTVNNAPLADATFDIYDSNQTTKIGTITTTLPNGDATIKVPHAGTYYLKEVKAPDGYILKEGFIEVEVNKTVNVVEKTIYNEKEAEYWLKIYKKDKVNNAPLADAIFDIYDSDQTTKIGTVTTTLPNGDATIRVPGPGTYYLKEVSAPDGYTLKSGFIEVIVGSNTNVVEKTIYNEKEYWIKIYKKDKVNNAPLADATFDIYDSDQTTKIGTITTTLPNGDASIKVPHAGTYYLKEVTAPEGYTLKSGFIAVTVDSNTNVVDKTIYNEKEYFLHIYKRDIENNAPLADATFDLYQADKTTKVGTITTTLPNGDATIKVPSQGTYYLKEVKAPDGYTLKSGFIEAIVGSNTNVVEKTIYDEKEGNKDYYLHIYKRDKVNNAPLADATFDLYQADKTTKIGTITTKLPDGDASIKVPNPGTYYLKEVKAPNGYTLKSGFIEVTVGSNTNVVEKTIYNEKPQEYFLHIYKRDTVNNAPLANATFDVYDSNYVKINTVTTTLPNGDVTIKVPSIGTYYLKEVKAPEGYILKSGFIAVTVGSNTNVVEKTIYNEQEDKQEYWIKVYKRDTINNAPLADATFEVFTESNISLGTFTTTLPNGEGTFRVPSPGVYYLKEIKAPDGYTLKQSFIPVTVSKTNNVVQTTIYNEQTDKEKYILKVYKKDTTNKVPLEHAVIGVYDSTYKQIGTITTTIPDGSGYFEVDYPGQFYFKEIKAPKGYILKEGFIPVTVNSNTNIVETSIYNEKDEETVYNLITVYKVDQDNNALKGVKIGLYDKKGKLLETGYTDSKGIVKFEDLDDGTYYVQEIEGLLGYEEMTDQIKVTVSDGDSKKVTITNKEIVTEESAWISIKKYVEGSSTPLAGVEFTITGSNGYKSVHTTDNLGSIYINVPVGQYTVTETKGAQGYQMDSTPKTVQAIAGTVANEVVFYNKPANGTLVITKVDSTSKEKLSGASFDIIDTVTNANVRTVMTDSNGTANVTLPFGTYRVVETQAPTGYVLDVQNGTTITLSAENTLQSITVENSKIPVVTKTPKTGATPMSMGTVLSFLLAIVSAAVLILLHRNEIKRLFNR